MDMEAEEQNAAPFKMVLADYFQTVDDMLALIKAAIAAQSTQPDMAQRLKEAVASIDEVLQPLYTTHQERMPIFKMEVERLASLKPEVEDILLKLGASVQ